MFSAALGPGVSAPPPPLSEAPWATRICPVIHYSAQSGGGHGGGGGRWWPSARRIPAETRWLANQKASAALIRPETRGETNEEEEED